MLTLLDRQGRTGLDPAWTLTPVGGADKVPTFVALLGSQKGLTVATLIDIQQKDQQQIENLYKKKLLKKKNVLTFADFTNSSEADIEDMFEPDFYLDLVNKEYATELSSPILMSDLNTNIPRILVQLAEYFKNHPMSVNFSHYRPARYFVDHIIDLQDNLSEATLKRFENAFEKLNRLIK